MPNIFFETLGCAKNEVDTRAMIEKVRDAGFCIVDSKDQADAVVVNTCSFIQSATEESIEAVLEATEGEDGKTRPVIVAGCMPARFGEELEEALPEVSSFVPCSKEDDIVAILQQFFPHFSEHACQSASADVHGLDKPVWAYVKISDGCSRWCSFCTIPSIRGPYRSFSAESICTEVRKLHSLGTKEIVLIGQDTGLWGSDFDEPSSLAWLLQYLAQTFSDIRFRVMYTEPEGITDELLTVLQSMPNVCRYLDIPLQHVVPHILKAMNRKGSGKEFASLIQHIRQLIPDVTLRTTFIAGFPGESEEDFEELLDFVQEGYFDYVGVFAFSPEEGTKAATLDDQVPVDVKEARARQLRDEADSVSATLIAERIGASFQVLIEATEEDGQVYGRAACQAPEVDGVTYVNRGLPGNLVTVRIDDTLLYDMEGEVL